LLPSKGLWFPDYEELVLAAQVSGVQLTFAGLGDAPSEVLATSKPGIAVPDKKLDSTLASEPYDGVVFIGYSTEEFQPGGVGGADTARLINEFQMDKKILGAVCSGQRVLAQHGALRGKQVTPAVSVHSDEIKYGGASRTEDHVVRDGNVITAAEARFAGRFMSAITSAIAKKSTMPRKVHKPTDISSLSDECPLRVIHHVVTLILQRKSCHAVVQPAFPFPPKF
jgi:putative intracellular protease/amidase